jgi:hypothetical protein
MSFQEGESREQGEVGAGRLIEVRSLITLKGGDDIEGEEVDQVELRYNQGADSIIKIP